MAVSRAVQLKEAMRERLLISFLTRFDASIVLGYVLDVGPKFFLLAVVNDRIHFEGFECIRISDVSGIEPERHAAFVEAALEKRGEKPPRKPEINLDSIEELLATAGRAFPLVTIHKEKIDPEICWIGRVVGIEQGRLCLHSIDPDARWDTHPPEYTHRLADITRVTLGADYEQALHLVGGDPPTGHRSLAERIGRRGPTLN